MLMKLKQNKRKVKLPEIKNKLQHIQINDIKKIG